MEFKVRNVNEMLPLGIDYLKTEGVEADTRNGVALAAPEPVVVTYRHPWECFVTSPLRRQNVTFLIMEALWILAGREDVAWLRRFNEKMVDYSDDGIKFHAPYGHRLIFKQGFNQLTSVTRMLADDPTTRRAVAQIWDAPSDLGTVSKDLPCNMMLDFKIDPKTRQLNLAVFNRSNDLIWGMCNANAVQFAFIQEVVAAMVGVPTGTYSQITTNMHMYKDTPNLAQYEQISALGNWYIDNPVYSLLGNDAVWFYTDLKQFMDDTVEWKSTPLVHDSYKSTFFTGTVVPLYNAWMQRKYWGNSVDEYREELSKITKPDVKLLAMEFIKNDV
jgi:hypothetical protein